MEILICQLKKVLHQPLPDTSTDFYVTYEVQFTGNCAMEINIKWSCKPA